MDSVIQKGISTDSVAQDDYSKDDDQLDNLTCDALDNKNVIYRQMMENDSYGFIKYDTSDILIVHGHFISADSNSTLVLIPGDSGPPCGSGCNMLLLYSCGEKTKLVLNLFSGSFSRKDICDLDNDGILEIITGYEIMNMGECMDCYQIKNFANGKENILFESYSNSVIGCGGGDQSISWKKKGDTVGTEIKTALIDPDHDSIFEVREFREFKIFNGGKTEDQAIEREIHKYDTIVVPLKKLKK